MSKSVSRVVVIIVAIAAVLSVFSLAEAQYTQPDPVVPTPRGSTFEPDPATANTGFLGFNSVNPVASGPITDAAGGTDGTGGTGGGLAITGTETNVALALGVGLLAVGGTAVIASRKRSED